MPKKEVNSMPEVPAVEGHKWTKSKCRQLLGKWVKVGYENGEPDTGLVIDFDNFSPQMFVPSSIGRQSYLSNPQICRIDCPDQVISIGETITVITPEL